MFNIKAGNIRRLLEILGFCRDHLANNKKAQWLFARDPYGAFYLLLFASETGLFWVWVNIECAQANSFVAIFMVDFAPFSAMLVKCATAVSISSDDNSFSSSFSRSKVFGCFPWLYLISKWLYWAHFYLIWCLNFTYLCFRLMYSAWSIDLLSNCTSESRNNAQNEYIYPAVFVA